MSVFDQLTDPDVLDGEADLAALLPPPYGPALSAALHLASVWIRSGKTQAEIDAIVARCSVAAQDLANDWHG